MIKLGDFQVNREQRKIIKDILDSGRITEGKYVKLFEEELAKFLGVKHAIAVTNGTVALQLLSQYFGKSKKVCIPAMTFPATINAFETTGQNTMLCDIGEDLQINIDSLTETQKKSIDILVPVHLMGYTSNMEHIMREAKKYGWIVIEDTAEAFGAKIGDKYTGTFGNFGTFSFYVSHNIIGGELGAIVTNDNNVNEILRSMKNHGRTGSNLKFEHSYIGSNYKTTEFCTGIAYENILNANKILNKRFLNALYFQDNINNPKLYGYSIDLGFSPLGYPIKAKTEEIKKEITSKLKEEGIETRNIFPCLANQKAYEGRFNTNDYPVANKMEKLIFYIGVHQFLKRGDLNKIVKVLNDF